MDTAWDNNEIQKTEAAPVKDNCDQIIGSDETGKAEPFRYMVVTAAYVDGKNEFEKYTELGVRDSKSISSGKKIREIAERVIKETFQQEDAIRSWNDIEKLRDKRFGDKILIVTDRFVTEIMPNERYNERHGNGENQNDILKEMHLDVLRELSGRNPGSKIVVDNFCDSSNDCTEEFRQDIYSRISERYPIRREDICVIKRAEERYKAVALASIISTYIRDLCFEHVQNLLNDENNHYSQRELWLPKNNPSATGKTSEGMKTFLDGLNWEEKEEGVAKGEAFINKYVKKNEPVTVLLQEKKREVETHNG